jgi:uncharacterized protein (TIGR03437 family)
VTIDAATYIPGTKQTITVTVKHPEATRWGFQLTARMTSDQTKEAGVIGTSDTVRVRCETGEAPCNGGLEFAEHLNAPVTAAGEGFTFKFDWTPPSADVGNVIFYAAANAANGNGNPTGDRIYTTLKTITPNRPCTLSQTPSIAGVSNGASFQPGIGPGAMISIFGSGFQPAGASLQAGGADLVDNGFPRQFSCVAVEIGGKRVPIAFASNAQINAQAPFDLAAGPVPVRVIANPDLPNQLASDPATATVQELSPAFFPFGKGAVAATVPNSTTPIADPASIPGAVPAKPGDTVTLWATGLGPTAPAFAEGVLVSTAAKVTSSVTLTIGGVPVPDADVSYVGMSPNSISGLYQINVKIPASVQDGNAAVALQVGSAKAQDGMTLAIKR